VIWLSGSWLIDVEVVNWLEEKLYNEKMVWRDSNTSLE
jgi:hypothetical protein